MGLNAITGPNFIVPTPPVGDSSNQAADTAFVGTAISSAIAGPIATAIASAIAGIVTTVTSKVISFSFDVSTSSNFSTTGVGFKPGAAIFLATVVTNQNVIGVGVAASSTNFGGIWGRGSAASVPNYTGNTTDLFSMITNGTANQTEIRIVSFDNDGFTFSRTLTGAPTGTATCVALVLK